MKISIVIPCRNESKHITDCLDSILANDFPVSDYEVLVSDGQSTDGTRDIVAAYSRAHPNIKLLDNTGKTTPKAFNLGIKNANGEFILIMSAHCTYPKTYISDTLALFLSSDAANVGGRFVNIPNGVGPWAEAVAIVTAHRFGVGNGAFRVSTGERVYADTVAFGLYRKAIFDEIGFFDERLTRNQDNELNDRLRRAGHKIILDPKIEVYYKNQAALSGLMRQGFNTGKWNVYTLVLHPYTFKWRRFVPGVFVLYLLLIPFIALWGQYLPLYLFPAILYILIDLLVSATRNAPMTVRLKAFLTFLGYHLSYGAGTVVGFFNVGSGLWKSELGHPLVK